MNEITKELLDALKGAVAQMNLAAECVERGRHDEAILHLRSLTRGRSEAIAKAEAILAATEPSYDDWIPWKGGECPVGRRDVVMVKGKNGEVDTDKAHFYDWHHTGSPFDIVTYREVKP